MTVLEPIEKATVSFAFLALSVGVLISHKTGSLFPALPFTATTSLIIIALCVLFQRQSSWYLLIASILVGLVYRIYTFTFPSSLISFDPDAYAVRALIVAQDGSTANLLGSFYQQAAIFSIFNAESILILDVSAPNSLITTPILSSILTVLGAAAIVSKLTNQKNAIILSGILATITPTTVKFGVRPNPIFFSSLIFVIFAVSFISFSEKYENRYIYLISVAVIAMIFTHKIAVVVVLVVLIAASLAGYMKLGKPVNSGNLFTLVNFTIALTASLVIQWLYITDYSEVVVARVINVFSLGGESEVPRTAAVMYDPGLLDSVLASSYILTSLGFGGLSFLYVWFWRRRDPRTVRLLSIVAGTVGFSLLRVLLESISTYQRTAFFATVALAALIAIASNTFSKYEFSLKRGVIIGGIVLLLLSYPASNAITPDYRDSPRQYLTAQEVTAKEWAYSVTDVLYMDEYYQDEVVRFKHAATDGGWEFQSQVPRSDRPGLLTRELTNGTLLGQNYSNILLRTDVNVYRMDGGRWVLTWNPVSEASRSTRYHKVYSNGGAIMFSNKPK